jgi:hypothetical protein
MTGRSKLRHLLPTKIFFSDSNGKPIGFQEAVASGLSVGTPGNTQRIGDGASRTRQIAMAPPNRTRHCAVAPMASKSVPGLHAALLDITRIKKRSGCTGLFFLMQTESHTPSAMF